MSESYFSNMIQEMYDVEATVEVQEWETSRFTANIALKNLQMLDAIAARFKTSRASIVEDALNHAVYSMFISLDEEDREQLGKQCDEQYLQKMKEVAQDNNGTYEHAGLGNWASLNYAIRKSDEESNNA
jgi:hypothetical protein